MLICVDIPGTALTGARYMLTFIDDYSRKVWPYFLKSVETRVIYKGKLLRLPTTLTETILRIDVAAPNSSQPDDVNSVRKLKSLKIAYKCSIVFYEVSCINS